MIAAVPNRATFSGFQPAYGRVLHPEEIDLWAEEIVSHASDNFAKAARADPFFFMLAAGIFGQSTQACANLASLDPESMRDFCRKITAKTATYCCVRIVPDVENRTALVVAERFGDVRATVRVLGDDHRVGKVVAGLGSDVELRWFCGGSFLDSIS